MSLDPSNVAGFPVTARSKRVVAETALDVLLPQCIGTGRSSPLGGGAPASGSRSPARSPLSSRPNTARSTLTSARSTRSKKKNSAGGEGGVCAAELQLRAMGLEPADGASLYTVIKHCQTNISTTSARAPAAAGGIAPVVYSGPSQDEKGTPRWGASSSGGGSSSSPRAPPPSGRPLTAEYSYAVRNVSLTGPPLVGKADMAIAKHYERQRKLERQRAKLQSAAPMQFKWAL